MPENVAALELTNISGDKMNSMGEVVNNAIELIEQQSEQLVGVLPKEYTMFSDELLAELLRIFNNSALDEMGGRIHCRPSGRETDRRTGGAGAGRFSLWIQKTPYPFRKNEATDVGFRRLPEPHAIQKRVGFYGWIGTHGARAGR